MAVHTRKTMEYIFLITVVTVSLWIFAWAFLSFETDTTAIKVLEMHAQQTCVISDLERTGKVNQDCFKEKFSGVVTLTNSEGTKDVKFGDDVTSELAFCDFEEKNFLCIKHDSLVKGTEVNFGIVYKK